MVNIYICIFAYICMFAFKKNPYLYYYSFLFPSLQLSPIRYSSTSGTLNVLSQSTRPSFYAWSRLRGHLTGLVSILYFLSVSFADSYFQTGSLMAACILVLNSSSFSLFSLSDLKHSQGFSHWQHAENCQDCFLRLEFSALDPHTKLSSVMTRNIHKLISKTKLPISSQTCFTPRAQSNSLPNQEPKLVYNLILASVFVSPIFSIKNFCQFYIKYLRVLCFPLSQWPLLRASFIACPLGDVTAFQLHFMPLSVLCFHLRLYHVVSKTPNLIVNPSLRV